MHTMRHTGNIHHFPDKMVGHRPNVGKVISKQTSVEVMNSGATTKR